MAPGQKPQRRAQLIGVKCLDDNFGWNRHWRGGDVMRLEVPERRNWRQPRWGQVADIAVVGCRCQLRRRHRESVRREQPDPSAAELHPTRHAGAAAARRIPADGFDFAPDVARWSRMSGWFPGRTVQRSPPRRTARRRAASAERGKATPWPRHAIARQSVLDCSFCSGYAITVLRSCIQTGRDRPVGSIEHRNAGGL